MQITMVLPRWQERTQVCCVLSTADTIEMSETSESPVFISRWMERAERSVGVITLLIAISCFGVGALVAGPMYGAYVAIIAFGIVGGLEVFHIQAKAEAKRRTANLVQQDLFWGIYEKYSRWQPKILKEFTHNGLEFRSIGFEELQIPLGITPPLCPTCKSHLAERISTGFPGRVRIEFFCSCGNRIRSKFTKAEVMEEAAHLASLPSNDAQSAATRDAREAAILSSLTPSGSGRP